MSTVESKHRREENTDDDGDINDNGKDEKTNVGEMATVEEEAEHVWNIPVGVKRFMKKRNKDASSSTLSSVLAKRGGKRGLIQLTYYCTWLERMNKSPDWIEGTLFGGNDKIPGNFRNVLKKHGWLEGDRNFSSVVMQIKVPMGPRVNEKKYPVKIFTTVGVNNGGFSKFVSLAQAKEIETAILAPARSCLFVYYYRENGTKQRLVPMQMPQNIKNKLGELSYMVAE